MSLLVFFVCIFATTPFSSSVIKNLPALMQHGNISSVYKDCLSEIYLAA